MIGINQTSVFRISMSSRNSYVEILPKKNFKLTLEHHGFELCMFTYTWIFFPRNMSVVLQDYTVSGGLTPKCTTADSER